jgi:hypothetical protein
MTVKLEIGLTNTGNSLGESGEEGKVSIVTNCWNVGLNE